jgi:hypothetical protein
MNLFATGTYVLTFLGGAVGGAWLNGIGTKRRKGRAAELAAATAADLESVGPLPESPPPVFIEDNPSPR